jgi:hypothetical protein
MTLEQAKANNSYFAKHCAACFGAARHRPDKLVLYAGFGSYFDMSRFAMTGKEVPKRDDQMCDPCILQRLRQGTLKLIYLGGSGDVSGDYVKAEMDPSQEDVDRLMAL